MTDETITLAQAVEQRDAYLQASKDLAEGKTTTVGNRQYTVADAQEIRDQLTYWTRAIKSIKASNAGVASTGHKVASWT